MIYDGKLAESELRALETGRVSARNIALIESYLSEYKECLTGLRDLTGDPLIPKRRFYSSMKRYGYLLSNDPKAAIPESDIRIRRRFLFKLVQTVGPLFTRSVIIHENRNELLGIRDRNGSIIPDPGVSFPDEPVILVSNHHFRDDAITPLTIAKRPYYILFGSIPQLYNSMDGLFAYMIGSLLVNRKVKSSRAAIFEKAKYLMERGVDVLYYPEGTWNKTPNKLLIDFWPGVWRMANETGAKIVPVVDYLSNTAQDVPKKKNPIHLVIDDPVDITHLSEQEGLEKLREIMGTWYYLMMEKYGKATRECVLAGYSSANEAWESTLKKLDANVVVLDSEVENRASYEPKSKVPAAQVFRAIAELPVTKQNAAHVAAARMLMERAKREDYQHRF